MILALQNRILEMTARGASLATTLDCLCQEVEGAATDVVCSVLSVDPSGALHPLSGPSLPDSYSAALDGLQMGPLSGSCGTAAYLGEPVIVIDIENDPRWASFKQLALPLGFKACWSTPIESAGRVCGTFAFYFKTCRGPSSFEISLLEACVHLCAIAIERNDRVLERQRLTYTDTLTGLPNRTRFQEYLAERSQSIGAAWGILIIDIDNLKPVNDTFGHGAGDDLIKIVASRISLVSGHGSTFRVGGDEFAAIVDGEDNDLRETAEKILASLKPTCVCETHVVFPAATIGGAIWKNHANPELVRRDADLALYHAKETKRGRYVEYYGGLGSTISRRFRAIRNVGLALRENRIDAYYQPIIRLDTREIVGVEALCRMTAETGAIIAASHFHEATKDAHVASELTQRMLGLVASDVRRWLDLGIPFQHVGINLSAADFHLGDIGQRLNDTFSAVGVPLKHVILEVTESVYFGHRDHVVADEIEALRAGGLRVALDDFGTGFASLTHLLSVPVDIIKIDKTFVARLVPGDAAVFIIEALLAMARSLGIGVVAEGIETAAQAEQLVALGCKLGQGYLYSKAVDREAATQLLQHGAQRIDAVKARQIDQG